VDKLGTDKIYDSCSPSDFPFSTLNSATCWLKQTWFNSTPHYYRVPQSLYKSRIHLEKKEAPEA